MKRQMLSWAVVIGLSVLGFLFAGAQTQKAYKPKPGETIVRLTIEGKGDIYLKLFTKEAPKSCANFLKLVKQKFYDGIRFHRVVPNFVAQAGDPLTKTQPLDDPRIGTGGPGYTIEFESNLLKHEKGSVGMARTQDPNSAGSQFYICLEPQPRLDGQYVVFAKVVQGMEIVEKIERGDTIKEAKVIQAPNRNKEKQKKG